MKPRTLEPFVQKFLTTHRKMVFLSGPRQVGKTTLARACGRSHRQTLYFNWDILTDQRRLARNPYFFEEADRTGDDLVLFDEIHKYARWKNYLKGAFDKYREDFLFLVTGSGRLDLYAKGGDSLLGRYLPLPLFPFTLSELHGRFVPPVEFRAAMVDGFPGTPGAQRDYRALSVFGGFPEPLTKGEDAFAEVWRRQRRTLLVREDIRDATRIRELSLLELLTHLVADRVGSPLSVNSLREDLGTAFETARDWLETLARFYFLFKVPPFAASLGRALRKEPKVYLYDWSELDDAGRRFENLVACHLFKAVRTWTAIGAGSFDLHYLRDKEKREVDFVVTERRRPVCLIEAKLGETELSPHLLHYQEKLGLPVVIQVVDRSGVERKLRRGDRVQWVVSADRWLCSVP
ncbi:MAG: ATP-binding protein [Deltaproteobacteria bacterium]|nr:ATP-binding protein [Deltaproteobacteria bacterium]